MANGIVVVPWIDAFDGTPLIDIKPSCDFGPRARFSCRALAKDGRKDGRRGLYFRNMLSILAIEPIHCRFPCGKRQL
jgi:hypothetical protein